MVERGKAYCTRMGAIALQGPHHVAKQSTMTLSLLMASLNSSTLPQSAMSSLSGQCDRLRSDVVNNHVARCCRKASGDERFCDGGTGTLYGS